MNHLTKSAKLRYHIQTHHGKGNTVAINLTEEHSENIGGKCAPLLKETREKDFKERIKLSFVAIQTAMKEGDINHTNLILSQGSLITILSEYLSE